VVADANGGNPRDLVSARGGWHTHWPAWSADGRFVYFSQTIATWNGEPSEILRVPVEGGEPQVVVHTTRRALFPLPSGAGGLFYAANPNGVDLDLWWRRSTNDEPQRLTTGVGEYAEPRVSSDGRRLVSTLIEYRRALVSIPVVFDGIPRLRSLTDGFGGDLEPCFSPSRGQVLYSTLADGPALTNGFLSWSPDGKRLAAVSVPGSANASIWVVEPDSSEPFRKLIEFPGEVRPRGITWTSDGSSLVFGRQEALSDLVLFERPE
jgi:Tol biopolymer transport system component